MLPDVIDEFAICTGEQKESIFYSFFVFFNKLASGIAISLSALILEYVGYKDCFDNCCDQPESVGQTLRMLIVPGPILMLLVALGALYFYPINEKRRLQMRDHITLMK